MGWSCALFFPSSPAMSFKATSRYCKHLHELQATSLSPSHRHKTMFWTPSTHWTPQPNFSALVAQPLMMRHAPPPNRSTDKQIDHFYGRCPPFLSSFFFFSATPLAPYVSAQCGMLSLKTSPTSRCVPLLFVAVDSPYGFRPKRVNVLCFSTMINVPTPRESISLAFFFITAWSFGGGEFVFCDFAVQRPGMSVVCPFS